MCSDVENSSQIHFQKLLTKIQAWVKIFQNRNEPHELSLALESESDAIASSNNSLTGFVRKLWFPFFEIVDSLVFVDGQVYTGMYRWSGVYGDEYTVMYKR